MTKMTTTSNLRSAATRKMQVDIYVGFMVVKGQLYSFVLVTYFVATFLPRTSATSVAHRTQDLIVATRVRRSHTRESNDERYD